jgi:DNA replication protein DnaC
MDFELFWREYPRKVGRTKALKNWWKLSESERVSVMCGLRLWKVTVQWQSNGGQFIPYASTFLAQKRYLDEPWTGAFEEKP